MLNAVEFSPYPADVLALTCKRCKCCNFLCENMVSIFLGQDQLFAKEYTALHFKQECILIGEPK